MDRDSSSAIIITVVVLCLIGLLNLAIGVGAVIVGAFPSAEGPVAPSISVGSIFFGLLLLVAGALWITSGAGYFTGKEWASTLALYIAPVIGSVNLIGVMRFWGFSVGIGWATLSTVAAMGSFWYISRKELASFFLIAVAEHAVVVIIFAMLIYAEPVSTAEPQDEEIIVTIEEIKQPTPPELIPRSRAAMNEQPALPKIKIQDVTVTDPGTEIASSVPTLPKTLAQIRDTGSDTVLRSPGRREREQRYQDTAPTASVESAMKSSSKSSIEIGPSKMSKDSPEATIAREYIPDDLPSVDERVGPSDGVAKPSFAGDLSGEIAGRKVVFWPKLPEKLEGTGGGSATVKFWVNPAGSVIKVEISKKSGNLKLDTMAMDYVSLIRFVALPRNVQMRNQWGIIPMNFELIRKTG